MLPLTSSFTDLNVLNVLLFLYPAVLRHQLHLTTDQFHPLSDGIMPSLAPRPSDVRLPALSRETKAPADGCILPACTFSASRKTSPLSRGAFFISSAFLRRQFKQTQESCFTSSSATCTVVIPTGPPEIEGSAPPLLRHSFWGESCGGYECRPLSSLLSETYAAAIQLRGSFAGSLDVFFDYELCTFDNNIVQLS